MDNKYQVTGSLLGVILILSVFTTLYTNDYREILSDNPDFDLILLNYDNDKIELLSRVSHPLYDFYRWKFQNGKTTLYFERDKVATSYWQIFKGSKGVWFNEKSDIFYDYNNESVFIAQDIEYFFDSRHTNKAGTLSIRIEIYPRQNKETIKWIPETNDNYCIRWIVETDDYNKPNTYKTDKFEALLHKYVKVDWTDSQEKVSYGYKYKNGKIRIGYKCVKGEQLIDPGLGDYLPEGTVNIFLDGDNFSKDYEYDEIVNITAVGNVSATDQVCIDFTAPGYGFNYSCGLVSTSFLWTTTAIVTQFVNGLTEINLSMVNGTSSTSIPYSTNIDVNYLNLSIEGHINTGQVAFFFNESMYYYTLDEFKANTTFALDEFNTFNGTATGIVPNVTGKLNEAVDFDTSTDQIVVNGLQTNQNFTINFWFYSDNTPGGNEYIYVIGSANSFYIRVNNNFNIEFQTDIGASTSTGNNAIVAGKWYMLTFVKNGTNATLYLNSTQTSSTATAPNIDSLTTHHIGNRASANSGFDGKIDEISYWNRTLSVDEINLLYNNYSARSFSEWSNINKVNVTFSPYFPEDFTIDLTNDGIDEFEVVGRLETSLVKLEKESLGQTEKDLQFADPDGTGQLFFFKLPLWANLSYGKFNVTGHDLYFGVDVETFSDGNSSKVLFYNVTDGSICSNLNPCNNSANVKVVKDATISNFNLFYSGISFNSSYCNKAGFRFGNLSKSNYDVLIEGEIREDNNIINRFNDSEDLDQIILTKDNVRSYKYANVPKKAVILNASITVNNISDLWIEFSTPNAHSSNGTFYPGHGADQSNDNDLNTYSLAGNGLTAYVFSNYNITSDEKHMNLTTKTLGNGAGYGELDLWNGSDWVKQYDFDLSGNLINTTVDEEFRDSSEFEIKVRIYRGIDTGGQDGKYYENNLWVMYNDSPTNFTFDFLSDGSIDYNSDILDSPVTIDFTNELQTFLDSCVDDQNGNCAVNFSFSSNKTSVLNITDLSINFTLDMSQTLANASMNEYRLSDECEYDINNQCEITILLECKDQGKVNLTSINLSVSSFPENISFDFTDNGIVDINITAEFNGTTGIYNVSIPYSLLEDMNDYSENYLCADETLTCDIPIRVRTDSSGIIKIQNISLIYPIQKQVSLTNGTDITEYLFNITLCPSSPCNVPINITSQNNTGKIRLYNISTTFKGTVVYEVTGRWQGNTSHAASNQTVNLSVYYSPISVNFPKPYQFFNVYTSSGNEKNVVPWGQTSIVPIFNVTANTTHDQGTDITVSLNETMKNITIFASNSSDFEYIWILNETQQEILKNITKNSSLGIWVKLNFTNFLSTARWIDPVFYFTPWCGTCYQNSSIIT